MRRNCSRSEPRHLPQRAGEQVHVRPDRRTLVPQVRHLPRQGAEPDAVLPPARHVRGVEPRLRPGFPAVPVRGAHRGGRGVQGDHRRHPALRALLVPQRVQALRPRQPSAAELPRSPAGTSAWTSRSRPDWNEFVTELDRQCCSSADGSTPPGLPHHRRDLPRHVSRIDEWIAVRRKVDPDAVFASDMARRLELL